VKTYRVLAPLFLTSALDGGEWSASRPWHFTTGERTLDTDWIGGWVDPRAGMDAVEKRKILQCRAWNPGRPARSPSLYWLNHSQLIKKIIIPRPLSQATSYNFIIFDFTLPSSEWLVEEDWESSTHYKYSSSSTTPPLFFHTSLSSQALYTTRI
jgi:hypothetical protein